MFKRIMSAVVAFSMIASPVMAKSSFSSGGSFSSSRSFSSGSSFRSSSFSSTPSYRSSGSFSSGSTYRPTTTYRSSSYSSSPSFSSGSTYNYRPSQTVNRTGNYYSTNRGYNPGPTVVNHNYGGGLGGSTFGSPWFWMWMMDRHQTPVYVNNGGGAPVMQGGVAGPVVVDNGPGFFSMIFWGFINLLILIAGIWAIVWIVRKFIWKR